MTTDQLTVLDAINWGETVEEVEEEKRGVTNFRKVAREAATTARSLAFRMLAYEHGGVTERNREFIEEQADRAAFHARQRVYLANGYSPCIAGCGRLAGPNYAFCPGCQPR